MARPGDLHSEVSANGARPWPGAGTSAAAFVGAALRGPMNLAARVRGFADYESAFGGLSADSDLSYAVRQFFQNGGSEAYVVRTADAHSSVIGDRALRQGLYALEDVDAFNLLCLPGVSEPGVLAAAVAYCEERGAFLIMDAPVFALSPEQVLAAVSGSAFPKSDHAAVYYPWVYVAESVDGDKRWLAPPSGSIAGLYARTDRERGVWKAPAGNRARLTDVKALDHLLSDDESDRLRQLGVNCLRMVPGLGAVCWSARTLRQADQSNPAYEHVPVRRMASFLEESIYRGLDWAIYESNNEELWKRIRLQVDAFMKELFVSGAFQGSTAQEAYFVQCDSDTTTQADRDRGLVSILVGFAPLKPAEFVTVKIQQRADWSLDGA